MPWRLNSSDSLSIDFEYRTDLRLFGVKEGRSTSHRARMVLGVLIKAGKVARGVAAVAAAAAAAADDDDNDVWRTDRQVGELPGSTQ